MDYGSGRLSLKLRILEISSWPFIQWREADWQIHILLIYIWVRMEHIFQWGGTKWGTDTNQIPPKSNM